MERADKLNRFGRIRENFSLKNAASLGTFFAAASIPTTEFSILAANFLTQGSFPPESIAQVRETLYPMLSGFGLITGGVFGGFEQRESKPKIGEVVDKGARRFSLEKAISGSVTGFLTGVGVDSIILTVMSAGEHISVDTLLVQPGVTSILAWMLYFCSIAEGTMVSRGSTFFYTTSLLRQNPKEDHSKNS